MSDGPEWFAPKRYGYGSGPPISWQGWAVTIAYIAIAVMVSVRFKDDLLALFAILVPATLTFFVIAARTTRGGWKWRWGGDEE